MITRPQDQRAPEGQCNEEDIIHPLRQLPQYSTHTTSIALFHIDLDEGGQEVGNNGQDGVQDALDDDQQTVNDKVQGADKATESEDQGLDELENTIYKVDISTWSSRKKHRHIRG